MMQYYFEEAIKFYESSLTIRQKFLTPQHPGIAKCYNNMKE
jgi:hypothetical protein